MTISSLSGSGNAVAPFPPEQPARSAEHSVQAAPSQANPTSSPSFEQVQQATQAVQAMVQSKTSALTFSIDKESGKTIVKVMDAQSGEVLRQIPSEEMIALSHAMSTMQNGLLIKQSV